MWVSILQQDGPKCLLSLGTHVSLSSLSVH
jgi:hypothetical protein